MTRVFEACEAGTSSLCDPEVRVVVFEADRSFLRGFLLLGASQALQQAQNLAFLVFFVRLAGAEAFGAWNLVILTTNLVMLLALMALPVAIIRFSAGDHESPETSGRVRGLLRLCFLLGVIGSLVAFALAGPLAGATNTPSLALVLRVAAPLVLLQGMVMSQTAALTAAHRTSQVALASVFLTLLELMCTAGALLVTRSLLWAVLAYMIAKTMNVLVLAALVRKAFPHAKVARLPWLAALRYAAPTLPAAVAIWILNSSDRYVIGHFDRVGDVGAYAALMGFVSLLLLVPVPLSLTLFPRIVQLLERGDTQKAERYLQHAFSYLFIALAPLSIGLFVVGDEILAAVASVPIAVAGNAALPWAIVAAGLWALATPYFAILQAADRTAFQGIALGGSAVVVLLLGIALVPPFGIAGAAIARALGLAALLFTLMSVASSKVRLSLPVATIVSVMAASASMWIVAAALLPVTGWRRLAVIIVVSAATYISVLILTERAFSSDERVLERFLHPRFWLAGATEETASVSTAHEERA